jgi:hypothetical protein
VDDSIDISRLANALQTGLALTAGDTLAALGSPQALLPVYAAAWRLGVCVAPLDTGTLGNAQTLAATHASALIVEDGLIERARQALRAPNGALVKHFAAWGPHTGIAMLESFAREEPARIAPPREILAGPDQPAVVLYLYFMQAVQHFTYSRAEIREYVDKTAAGRPARALRPKLAAATYYPIVDDLFRLLAAARP